MLLLLLRHIFLTKCQLDATNHGCHVVPYHKKSLDFNSQKVPKYTIGIQKSADKNIALVLFTAKSVSLTLTTFG